MTIKNILLVGKTGNGKSTLGNVLVNKNDNFDEVFERGKGSTAKTYDIKSEKFVVKVGEWLEFSFRVIDTPGMGDNRYDEKQILDKLAELSKFADTGFYQVLFVVKGRFNKEDIEIYNSFREVFGEDIKNYTTVVQTDFEDFQEEEECEADRKNLTDSNKVIKEMFESCNGVIHVNNPPFKKKGDNEDVREIYRGSRKKILNHLLQVHTTYRPKDLVELNEKINEYLKKKEYLQKELEELRNIAEASKVKEQELKEKEEKIAKLEDKIREETKKSSYWKNMWEGRGLWGRLFKRALSVTQYVS